MRKTKDIFSPAIHELFSQNSPFLEPRSFQDYATANGHDKLKTAEHISINAHQELKSELIQNETMVLRLGSGTGTGTHFTLVHVENGLNDFFLFDDEIFVEPPSPFDPIHHDKNQFLAFRLLKNLTEDSLVNLGFASGLMNFALETDEALPTTAPATGQTTYTFEFYPHSSIPVPLTHTNGQVEIDALFIGKRNGVDTLFVIEAKCGSKLKSLSKHKLAYPILAIHPMVPPEMPIIPVYLKIFEEKDGLHYHVAECSYPDPRKGMMGINEIAVSTYKHLVLSLHEK